MGRAEGDDPGYDEVDGQVHLRSPQAGRLDLAVVPSGRVAPFQQATGTEER